jgi:hypothetical protein
MQLKYRLPLAILATAALAVSSLRAQDDDDEDDEFGSFGFLARSPQAISVALNLKQGANVKFGDLGVRPANFVKPAAANGYTRFYDDGIVYKDGLRLVTSSNPGYGEYDDLNQPISFSGPRYKTPASATVTTPTDYLRYQEDKTREWQYNSAAQAVERNGIKYIAFNQYSAYSKGESVTGSRGYTGGVELAVAHNFGNSNKRVNFSMTASLTLTGINSSKTGQVNARLQTNTDFYRFQPYEGTDAPALANLSSGLAPVPLYSGPSFKLIDGVNTETTTTLNNTAENDDDSTENQNVVVRGIWKIKGAYFTVKLGPQVTAMLTRSLGVRASAGVAGSYVGTTYSATESFTVPTKTTDLSTSETSTANKLLPGYYANIDATWTINDRTGMFAGVSYDNLGEYSQRLSTRTSKIDLSATAGIRGGLNIKF